MKRTAPREAKILFAFALSAIALLNGCEEPVPSQRFVGVVGIVRGMHCQSAIIELQNPADTSLGGGQGVTLDSCGVDSLGLIQFCPSASFPAIIASTCGPCDQPGGFAVGALVTVQVPIDTSYTWPCPALPCTTDLPRYRLTPSPSARRLGWPNASCGVRID